MTKAVEGGAPRRWSVGGFGFFNSHRVQFATMAARDWCLGCAVKVGRLKADFRQGKPL